MSKRTKRIDIECEILKKDKELFTNNLKEMMDITKREAMAGSKEIDIMVIKVGVKARAENVSTFHYFLATLVVSTFAVITSVLAVIVGVWDVFSNETTTWRTVFTVLLALIMLIVPTGSVIFIFMCKKAFNKNLDYSQIIEICDYLQKNEQENKTNEKAN